MVIEERAQRCPVVRRTEERCGRAVYANEAASVEEVFLEIRLLVGSIEDLVGVVQEDDCLVHGREVRPGGRREDGGVLAEGSIVPKGFDDG